MRGFSISLSAATQRKVDIWPNLCSSGTIPAWGPGMPDLVNLAVEGNNLSGQPTKLRWVLLEKHPHLHSKFSEASGYAYLLSQSYCLFLCLVVERFSDASNAMTHSAFSSHRCTGMLVSQGICLTKHNSLTHKHGKDSSASRHILVHDHHEFSGCQLCGVSN